MESPFEVVGGLPLLAVEETVGVDPYVFGQLEMALGDRREVYSELLE